MKVNQFLLLFLAILALSSIVSSDDYFDDPRCSDGNAKYWPIADCSSFIQCYKFHGYLMNCPNGLDFSPIDKTCQDPSTANCGAIVTPQPDPDPDCVGSSTVFPFVGDCTKYLECVSGDKQEQECPDGLWFNSDLLICDYPFHSGCVNEIV